MSLNIQEIIFLYSNEKATWNLLPYSSSVELFLKWINGNTCVIENYKNRILFEIAELEKNRIMYFVHEYLAIRLDKIRTNFFIEQANMSQNEKEFYEEHILLLKEFKLNEIKQHNSIEFVGCYFHKKISNLELSSDFHEINTGEFILVDFRRIKNLLEGKNIEIW